MESKIILAIMGKSGCGKTSLCLDIKEKYGDKVHMVKSKTTRAERTEDPADKESHIFCSIKDYSSKEAIAVYNSPKGYISWTDKECFEDGKINLYTIDPVAFLHEISPYCKEKDVPLLGVYIAIPEGIRTGRYKKRHGNLKGFQYESHLCMSLLDETNDFICIDGSGSRTSTLLQLEEEILHMISRLND